MQTKLHTHMLSALFLCTILSFFTTSQADITVKIEDTDKQWILTEAQLEQVPTLQASIVEVAGKTPDEIIVPNSEHANQLALIVPYLKLTSQLNKNARPESDPTATALEIAVTMKPGTLQEKNIEELLTLADAAYYWGVMPVGTIAIAHIAQRLCNVAYLTEFFKDPTVFSAMADTQKAVLNKINLKSPALRYWLIQDQILSNPTPDGQVPTKTFTHDGWVTSALFSPDGTLILTASHDNTAKLWDGGTGQLLRTFKHDKPVTLALFSPDGTQIVTASHDSTAHLWDRKTDQPIRTFKHDNLITSALFNPDGTQIVTASHDSTAKLWHRETGQLIRTFKHSKPVNSVLFSPDGTQILTASNDRTAKLWNGETDQPIRTFKHDDLVNSALFTPDEPQILTTSLGSAAKLLSRETGELIRTFRHDNLINSALFSPDETQLLTASHDSTAKLWHRETGELIRTFTHTRFIHSALFSPDGSQILTASHDSTAKLWHRETGQLIYTFKHDNPVNSALFSPDDTQILTTSEDETAKLWRVADKALQTYILQHIGLEQAALLVLAYDCAQKNAPLNLQPKAREIFEKLDQRLRKAIRSKCRINYVNGAPGECPVRMP